MMRRRGLLAAGLGLRVVGANATEPAAQASASPVREPAADAVRRGRILSFPRDHGAHLGSRTEWWYATGWLAAEGQTGLFGFQVTFFRSRTGLNGPQNARLVPRHLLFAHAALTDTARREHRHADRIGRWSGLELPDLRNRASTADADVRLGGWHMRRGGALNHSAYHCVVRATDFALDLNLRRTLPVLLQGDGGFSQKGPLPTQASHYTSETQVLAAGRVMRGSERLSVQGRAWIDHEWSDELLHPQAVGWDWMGINLDDGRSLTAFQLRQADGQALWAGGSLRAADGTSQSLKPTEVIFTAGRRWQSPQSRAVYPVEWAVQTPAGRWHVVCLMENQELDSRASTGTVYWEGLAELKDSEGQRLGLGYLEMTGYAGRLNL